MLSVPLVPFVAEPSVPISPLDEVKEEEAAVAVSCRTSWRTRLMRAGKVLTSPLRRRERAWSCMAVGQFELCESRLCRRRSWILQNRNRPQVSSLNLVLGSRPMFERD